MSGGPDGGAPRPPRRPRYRGTHPRRFEEKYKERDPSRYPGEREKVLAAGKTPAGSHVPVLLREVLDALAPRAGEVAVDATLGWGGHAEALLPRLQPGGRLIGLDVDPLELPRAEARLRALGYGPDVFTAVRSNFAGLPKALATLGLAAADLVLADLGVSSMQLDDPLRGFSWKHEAPLDLRMNPERGQPAGILLARFRREEIEEFLRRFGDEPEAAGIAEALAATIAARRAAAARETNEAGRAERPIHLLSTSDVTRAVESAYQGRTSREACEARRSSLSRTFQALRILVNEELTALDAFLRNLPSVLAPGGRVAILTFHSGEDRRVKKAFAAGVKAGVFSAAAPEVIRAPPEELRANPRSSAAKLRWAVRSPGKSAPE
jgi:16S rRNA (cytosine1402-N4)-methyltransferase